MNVDEMPAGRELDALVAEKVMGIDVSKFPIQHEHVDVEARSILEWEEEVSPFSTQIAAAWEVVEKLQATTHIAGIGAVDLCVKVGLSSDGAFCSIFECSPMGYVDQEKTFPSTLVRASTAPLAICRAALKAVANA